jgi:hypothetical protein
MPETRSSGCNKLYTTGSINGRGVIRQLIQASQCLGDLVEVRVWIGNFGVDRFPSGENDSHLHTPLPPILFNSRRIVTFPFSFAA